MNTLFPVEHVFPEGFLYIPDFLSQHEESDLYREILKIEFRTFTFQGYKAKRKVASFGYDWNFEEQALVKGKKIFQLHLSPAPV